MDLIKKMFAGLTYSSKEQALGSMPICSVCVCAWLRVVWVLRISAGYSIQKWPPFLSEAGQPCQCVDAHDTWQVVGLALGLSSWSEPACEVTEGEEKWESKQDSERWKLHKGRQKEKMAKTRLKLLVTQAPNLCDYLSLGTYEGYVSQF